jgi:DNA repair protein RecN (Recombination protein N)
MLASLTIANVVLIDKLTIMFDTGLCALTGETGAGKSILLDSLGLALGARADAGLVRKGADQASVIATFELADDHEALAYLKHEGIEVEAPLILRRVVNTDGKSRAFINDQPVTIGMLKDVGERLVEIHGQFDTQGLLNARVHRGLLDAYGVQPADLQKMKTDWMHWKERARTFEFTRLKMEKARAEEEYLRAALEDLDELSPKQNEEDSLRALRDRLMRRETTLQQLQAAYTSAQEAESLLNQTWRALDKIGADGVPMTEGLDRIEIELKEVIGNIEQLSADLDESAYNLTEIDDRLFALKAQARKHACTIDELPAKRDEIAALLHEIGAQDDALDQLAKDVTNARAVYVATAERVSAVRKKTAAKLDKLVNAELPPLKLEKARFETQLETVAEDDWSEYGIDRVQFLVATNPGAAAGPLGKIASGGEMARFMLALKVVLAEVGAAGTLVFDEVDSGIGGATADAVGERLARLAAKRQILVVTHSPQVAARAGHHWIVAKGGKEVKTTVERLPDQTARTEEIARMLSGAEITAEARAAAAKLLEKKAA